jgi:hypothetical protein
MSMTDIIERVAKAIRDIIPPELAAEIDPALVSRLQARSAIAEMLGPVCELIDKSEQAQGSLYCMVTTYQLRQTLGLEVSNWPPMPPTTHEAAPEAASLVEGDES